MSCLEMNMRHNDKKAAQSGDQNVNVEIFMAENPKMKRRRKIGQADSEEPARRTEVKVEMGRVKIDHSGGGMSGNVMILRGGS